MKKQKPVQMHVEMRPKSAWDKESQQLVDGYALVESRTGLTLRWAKTRDHLDAEVARGTRYY